MTRTFVWLAAVIFAVCGGRLAAADPPKGEFTVHDVSVWISDGSGSQANARDRYSSPFPSSVATSRVSNANAAKRPVAPAGLITFYGTPVADLDVELRVRGGSVVSHWPTAEALPNRVRWEGNPSVALLEKLDDEATLLLVEQGHWFGKPRAWEDALYIRQGARSERFLAYDTELNMPAPIQLSGGPDKFTVTNLSDAKFQDVLLVRTTPKGVRMAWIDELPKAKGANLLGPTKQEAAKNNAPAAAAGAKPAEAAKADPPKADDKPKGDAAATKVAAKDGDKADAKPAAKPAASLFGSTVKLPAATKQEKPAESGTAAPGDPAKAAEATSAKAAEGIEVTLADPSPDDQAKAKSALADALSERLAKAGLSTNETNLVMEQIGPLVLENQALVAIGRMDVAGIDSKLTLSVFPEPRKIVRVPLVIMLNIDPQIGGEVEQLIAQLGDAKYAAREDAQKRLTELGPRAFDALKKAINHSDMEVVVRAERVLLSQNQQAAGRQGIASEKPATPAKKK